MKARLEFGSDAAIPSLLDWQGLFETTIAHSSSDGAHDIGHLRRVWANFQELAEGGERVCFLTGLAASYFHDFVHVPKDSPNRAAASTFAARKSISELKKLEFPNRKLENVFHCIEAHSYSANIQANSIEAMLLSDADKLDALGEIGLARLFFTAGAIDSMLFHPQEPIPSIRPIDEKAYAVDHFFAKLQHLDARMYTERGQQEARRRIQRMDSFIRELLA